jgi:hypothetical protein
MIRLALVFTLKKLIIKEKAMNVKNQIFTHHMKAMMEFYCASPSHSYALPVNLCNTMNNTSITKNELLDAYVTSNTPVPSLSPIITSIESKLSTAVNNQQKAANDTIQQLDNNIPMSQVVQDLQQQKSTAKITINQLIEDSYNQLSDFGIQHPTSQAEILKFTRDLGDFTTGLLT